MHRGWSVTVMGYHSVGFLFLGTILMILSKLGFMITPAVYHYLFEFLHFDLGSLVCVFV